jgi:hypothetical protein
MSAKVLARAATVQLSNVNKMDVAIIADSLLSAEGTIIIQEREVMFIEDNASAPK